MLRAVAVGRRTYLRKPSAADGREFVDHVSASRDHLEPYVFPADSATAFRAWLARGQRADVEQFLVCRREDDEIAGFVNINEISGGSLRSGALGWAAFSSSRGRGHLTDGVRLVLGVGFMQLRLHRLEANVQPDNERSRAMAVRCGFRLEGFSPRYLRIGGQWRDHERWAILEEDWRTFGDGPPGCGQ